MQLWRLGMAQQPSEWSHQHNRSAYFPKWKKNSEVYRRNNNLPKTLPRGTPDTTLTSLLRQPSTIACYDQFDRNCVNIDTTEPPIPQSRAYRECPDGWPYQRLHWSQSAQSEPLAHSPMHSAVYGTRTELHHRYPDPSDNLQTGWLEAHHSFP